MYFLLLVFIWISWERLGKTYSISQIGFVIWRPSDHSKVLTPMERGGKKDWGGRASAGRTNLRESHLCRWRDPEHRLEDHHRQKCLDPQTPVVCSHWLGALQADIGLGLNSGVPLKILQLGDFGELHFSWQTPLCRELWAVDPYDCHGWWFGWFQSFQRTPPKALQVWRQKLLQD